MRPKPALTCAIVFVLLQMSTFCSSVWWFRRFCSSDHLGFFYDKSRLFVKRACLSVKEIRTKNNMNRQEILFWFILVQYWRYKSMTFPPLPLWKMDRKLEFCFWWISFKFFTDLQEFLYHIFLLDIRTRLLQNELNGIFVCKYVFNSLVSRPLEFWTLRADSLRSFNELLHEVAIRIPDKRFGMGRLFLAYRVLLTVVGLRQYPTYSVLSLTFGVSTCTVDCIIE